MGLCTEFTLFDTKDQTVFNCLSGADMNDFVVLRTEATVLPSPFLQPDDSTVEGGRVGDAQRQFVKA